MLSAFAKQNSKAAQQKQNYNYIAGTALCWKKESIAEFRRLHPAVLMYHGMGNTDSGIYKFTVVLFFFRFVFASLCVCIVAELPKLRYILSCLAHLSHDCNRLKNNNYYIYYRKYNCKRRTSNEGSSCRK